MPRAKSVWVNICSTRTGRLSTLCSVRRNVPVEGSAEESTAMSSTDTEFTVTCPPMSFTGSTAKSMVPIEAICFSSGPSSVTPRTLRFKSRSPLSLNRAVSMRA